MPAVAATESWNPIDHTSHGSSTSSTSTAPARIEPVLAAGPSGRPTSVSAAITPARITEGSAPVSTTKNATVPTPSANRGHRVSRSAAPSAERSARAPSRRSRPTPRAGGRARSPGSRASSPGSSCESSPSTSPSSSPASFGGNSRAIERPTNARNTCVARTNGLGRAARAARTRRRSSSAAMPRCRSDRRTPRRRDRRSTPSRSTSRRGPRVGRPVAAHPDRLADVARAAGAMRPRDVDTSPTSRSPPSDGSVRSEPSTVTRSGASRREQRPSSRASCTPPHPHPSASTPTSASAAARRSSAPGPARSGRRPPRPRPARGDEPGALQRTSRRRRRGAASHAPTSADSPIATAIHGASHGPGRRPRNQARPERGGGGRQWPRRSHRHRVADLLQGRRADAAHVLELVHRRERPVLRPVVDDGRRRSPRRSRSSVSSSVALAVLTLTSAPPPVSPVPGIRGAGAGRRRPRFGTRICVPSVSGAARFSAARSAPGRAPPAVSIASITRSPGRELVDAGLPHPPGDVDEERHGARRGRRRRRLRRPTPATPRRASPRPPPASAATACTRARRRRASRDHHDDQPHELAPRQRRQPVPQRTWAGRYAGEPTPAVTGITREREDGSARVTKFTSFGARTISFTIARSPIARRAGSDARASSRHARPRPASAGTSILSRTFPSTWITRVTVSSTASDGSNVGHDDDVHRRRRSPGPRATAPRRRTARTAPASARGRSPPHARPRPRRAPIASRSSAPAASRSRC